MRDGVAEMDRAAGREKSREVRVDWRSAMKAAGEPTLATTWSLLMAACVFVVCDDRFSERERSPAHLALTCGLVGTTGYLIGRDYGKRPRP